MIGYTVGETGVSALARTSSFIPYDLALGLPTERDVSGFDTRASQTMPGDLPDLYAHWVYRVTSYV